MFILIAHLASSQDVLFYNVENLFDTFNDPITHDDEFTPYGSKKWTFQRYRKKLLNISKVILSTSPVIGPSIIGLCEIENEQVLKDLILYTPLLKFNYSIIHYESPDFRGIDVAMLIDTSRISIIEESPIEVKLDYDSSFRTRDILYAKLYINQYRRRITVLYL